MQLHEEDLAILETVRKISQNEIPKFLTEENSNTVPIGLFRLFGEQGLAGLTTGEEYGGLERGALLTTAVMEEIASINLGPAIFLSVHLMVCKLIEFFGSDAQKTKYLPKLASGSHLGAFALTEAGAGSNASALKLDAKAAGDQFILNGEKCYISSAGWADQYIVFARTTPGSEGKEGISVFIVSKDTKGLSVGKPEKKMGCEYSPIATLTFSDARIEKDALLGEIGQGYRLALFGLAGGRVNVAAAANGLSRSAIERSVAHLKERKQFGRSLSEFQGLQFIIADMRMKYEAAKLLVLKAAYEMDNPPHNADPNLYPSVAKCFATDSAMQITTDAVQLLGGAGYIRDYGVEQLMRDAKMLQIVEGTNQIQRNVIARSMLQ